MSDKLCVWFKELTRDDVPLAGGKGANLGDMVQANLPVPPGFVITAPAYRRVIEHAGLESRIDDLLLDLDRSVCDQLQAVEPLIRDLFADAPIPGEIQASILEHYRRLGEDVPVAVRSSATAEDLPEASFAGQLETYLNVEGEDALLVAANQASQSLESSRLRRESLHLRDYLEKLLEHANIPVLVVGRDRSIRVVSRAFVRITGLDRDALGAKDVLQLASQADRARVLSAFVSAMRGREVPPFELRLPKAGGGHARLAFTLAPILDSEGRAAGVIAIGQDRTELRELEGQVLHAERLATLGQLAAGIVHEINNPLTSISVYGEYLLTKLKRTGAEIADLDRVERILQSSDRIMSFTRNLLTYARPSKEEAQPLDINAVVEEALGFCEHLIREARVTVSRDYADGLPVCHGVPGQLHQVFVNLITNACNAAREHDGQLSLTTQLAGRDRIQVSVVDDGVGISPEDLDRVFEPFFSTRRRGKGTGLGLSIVKNIVERHRGDIHIESGPGHGTTVLVTLPSEPS